MEYAGIDLYRYMNKYFDQLTEFEIRRIFQMVVAAMDECDKCNILHRDIKPENIIVKYDKETGKVTDIKLIDFGLAAKRADASRHFSENTIGTKGYVAPEVF